MAQGDGQHKSRKNTSRHESPNDALSQYEPKTEPPEGKVETEKHGYAAELIAYQVIDKLAGIIVEKLAGTISPTDDTQLQEPGQTEGAGRGQTEDKTVSARVLLVNDLEQALGGLALAEIGEQTSLLDELFDNRQEEHTNLLNALEVTTTDARALAGQRVFNIAAAPAAALMLLPQIPKAVGAVADVLAYFRSNYKIVGREVSVSKQALLISVAGSFSEKGIKALIPGFYAIEGSEILACLTSLAQKAAHLKTERDALATLLPESENGGGGSDNVIITSDQVAEHLARITAAVRETDAALLAYEGFRTAWTTPPEGEEETTLDRALLQEGIDTHDITHLLWLDTFSSGGETTVRDRIAFDRIGFLGGAAVGYVLADKGGEILAADTIVDCDMFGGRINDLTEGEHLGVLLEGSEGSTESREESGGPQKRKHLGILTRWGFR